MAEEDDVRRFGFATRDIGEAHDVLSRVYVANGLRLRRPGPAFEFRQEAVSAGSTTVGRSRYAADVDYVTEPLDHLLFVTVGAGRVIVRGGGDTLHRAAGEVLLNPVGHPLSNTVHHVDLHTLRLDRDMVAGLAEARTGLAAADFRFDGMAPVSAAMGRHWWETMAYLRRLFSGPAEPLINPLVVRASAELAASAALVVFPNTAMGAAYLPEPGAVAPAAVRRAVAFIEENAARPLTAEQIADAARVSARGLQTAFRRHLGITPMAHLRRVRLDGAHRDLQNADPAHGDTVAAVARRWGFTSMSRFAAEYRAAHGRLPSQTLRT